MAAKSGQVKAGPVEFDLTGVGDWALAHPYMFWGCIVAAFLFWTCRKNGILGLLIDYMKTKAEVNGKVEMGKLSLMRKFGTARLADALEDRSTDAGIAGRGETKRAAK